jgi:hypothetical protein
MSDCVILGIVAAVSATICSLSATYLAVMTLRTRTQFKQDPNNP